MATERRPSFGNEDLAALDPDDTDTETLPKIRDVTSMPSVTIKPWYKIPRCDAKKWVIRKLPILKWLPKYNRGMAISDFIAGITIGLMVIPQGIAYALIASLPPQYGLYSAYMGTFLYCLFGTSKHITVGPTAVVALLLTKYDRIGPEYALLLCFLSGIIMISLGLLKMGFLFDYISEPVLVGFISASAVTVASTQIGSLLGLEMVKRSEVTGVTRTWIEIVLNIGTIRLSDSILGITCTAILLSMSFLARATWFDPIVVGHPGTRCQMFWHRHLPPTGIKICGKILWVLTTARNMIIVVVCTGIAYAFNQKLPKLPEHQRDTMFVLTGNIEAGLPSFQLPPFSMNNTQTGQAISFKGMMTELGSGIITIPLIAILESVAIAKSLAGTRRIDANQEMLALGVCNLAGSFVKSMPVTGSFSRTAVNYATGVKSPASGIYTGILVILALGLLMPACAYIPKASLAAVIITAVIFSIHYEVVLPMWKSKKLDLIPGFITFFSCLFWALEYGTFVGIASHLILVLYDIARPTVKIFPSRVDGVPFLRIMPVCALVFPAVGYIRTIINKAGIRNGLSRWPVVLDCTHITYADFTAAKGIKSMMTDFRRRNQPIVFYKPRLSVAETLSGIGLDEFIVFYAEAELHQYIFNVSALYQDPAELDSVYYSASSEERSMEKTESVHRKTDNLNEEK